MRQEWEPEDLIEVWTLLEEDQERLRNKSGANRLGFALLLKFFEVEARFPEDAGEIPVPAVSYVAQQVKVPAEEWAAYEWSGRATGWSVVVFAGGHVASRGPSFSPVSRPSRQAGSRWPVRIAQCRRRSQPSWPAGSGRPARVSGARRCR
ncbi:DUF4158 domain-containing protein [Streptomyces sp. NRRL S-646]|uniref:DUF4158 domain-containing protein n=1 Tax=Streptomyces sp. NRRL S-646 TaxID=1463917 RepID=UPI0007C48562